MTARPQGRGPLPTQPTKPTTSLIHNLDSSINGEQVRTASRNRSRNRNARAHNDSKKPPSTSHAAALSLIRRVLVPDKAQNAGNQESSGSSIHDCLPPLTSSNDVDIQLYAIIAVIVKDFVHVWYSKITPDDDFSQEIVQIIAHCSRALEQRLRHMDIIELLLDDLAALIEDHVKVYRLAKLQGSKRAYALDARQVYHSINCHPALSPVPDETLPDQIAKQRQHEVVYRQLLVNGALALLLPLEDFQNAPLRILLADIIADLIVGQVLAGKVCEGWFIQDLITKVITLVKGNGMSPTQVMQAEQPSKSRLETFGLLHSDEQRVNRASSQKQSGISALCWTILQVIYLTIVGIRSVFLGLARARNSSGRLQSHFQGHRDTPAATTPADLGSLDTARRSVLTFNAFSTCATIIRFADRMPWLQSVFAFMQHWLVFGIGRLASANSVLDRYLYETLTTFLLPPELLPQILLSFRLNIFPNNTLGPPAPPPPSTTEEKQAIRRKAAESIASLIPQIVAHTYFNTTDDEEVIRQIDADILDCFSDAYLNKHLVYGMLDLILVKILPELADTSVVDLLAEKGVDLPSVHKEIDEVVVDDIGEV